MLQVNLNEACGRNAYLAAFHAAQALVFEKLGKTIKTHNGVQVEFLRTTKDDRMLSPDLRGFLSRAYNLKSVADYETGPSSVIGPDQAARSLAEGRLFVSAITQLVGSQAPRTA